MILFAENDSPGTVAARILVVVATAITVVPLGWRGIDIDLPIWFEVLFVLGQTGVLVLSFWRRRTAFLVSALFFTIAFAVPFLWDRQSFMDEIAGMSFIVGSLIIVAGPSDDTEIAA